MAHDDERWMSRALALATLSLGRTWPNPGVGCVIARDGALLGQGRHEACGEAHAEVRALEDCHRRGNDARGATIYVTLAPCTRQGRQPPCVNALFAARVARVVAGTADPSQDDPRENFERLGVAYRVGCLGPAARAIHGGFLARVGLGRPRITGKWAISADGFLAASGGASAWISGAEALALSRRRRRCFDAILVGRETARRDDPELLASRPRSHGQDNGPLRIVVSRRAELRADSRLVKSISRAPLLLIHGREIAEPRRGELRRLGVQVRECADPHDPNLIGRLLAELGINDLLVEGGSAVHAAFLAAGLYDRLELYLGLMTLSGGLPVASGQGIATPSLGARWELEEPPRALGAAVHVRLSRTHAVA
jgi:diaminohydroxyphosphoribosylaminopyrimidine deaminase/5-amino-6-(5-phosphoribosylamino)uracil reductase